MNVPSLILGSPQWRTGAALLMAVASLLILWSYARARSKRSVRLACAVLKALAFGSLALILLEPLVTGTRPRRGANAFAVLVDNSRSLLIRDEGEPRSRGDWMRDRLGQGSSWQARLGQDFDVRSYVFDSHLRSVDGFDDLDFDGTGSRLATSISALSKRFRGRPLAGVLLFSDGNRTDVGDLDGSSLPPVYPVVPPARGVARDVGVREVSISQTNFESAQVVLRADVAAVGFSGEPIVASVIDEAGKEVERQEAKPGGDGKPLSFRFQFRPEKRGVSFYTVRAFPAAEEEKTGGGMVPSGSSEQTLANNSRLVVVDQGGGPYGCSMGGRPNWESGSSAAPCTTTSRSNSSACFGSPAASPSSTSRPPATGRPAPFQGSTTPTRTRPRADQSVLVRLGTLDEVS
ncbi:MAG: hypothetical protein WKF75_06430 [Singulisphaera sp.]